MDRPRILRILRITWTAACAVVCVLLVLLWVRSQRWVDVASGPRLGSRIVVVGSTPGVFCFAFPSASSFWMSPWDKRSFDAVNWWKILVEDATPSQMWAKPYTSRMWGKFEYENASGTTFFPYWFGVLISATVATVLGKPWTWRFSLRTLLIAVTLLAVVLGIVIWAAK